MLRTRVLRLWEPCRQWMPWTAELTSPTRSCGAAVWLELVKFVRFVNAHGFKIYLCLLIFILLSGIFLSKKDALVWLVHLVSLWDPRYGSKIPSTSTKKDLAATQESLHTTQNSLSDCFNEVQRLSFCPVDWMDWTMVNMVLQCV